MKSPADNHRMSKLFGGSSLTTLRRWLGISIEIKIESAEPRDLIYAVLAISPASSSSQIMVDYAKPLRDVYLETLAVCDVSWGFASSLAAPLGLVIDEELERCILDLKQSQAL